MSLGGGHVGHICETVFFGSNRTVLGYRHFLVASLFFFGHLLGSFSRGTLRDTEGVKRVTRGVRGMGGGCQCKKDCKIEVAYSAWQNANVKPVVAKMAFIFVAPTRHVQQSAVVIQLVSNGLPMVDVSEFNSQAWLGSCSNLATMQKEPWAMAKRPSVAKMACVGCCLCVACKAGQNGL